MKISNRLNKISSLIPDNSIVTDVGSDHCYLLINLAKERKLQHGYAIENKSEPLLLSEKNVNEHIVQDKITLIFNHGVQNLDYESNIIVISGLGTTTIINILEENYEWYKDQKLILCPSDFNETFELRLFLHKQDFFITNEHLIYENGYYYIIFEASYKENYSKSLLGNRDIYLGQYLINDEKELNEYFNEQLNIMIKSCNYNEDHHKKVLEINKILKKGE